MPLFAIKISNSLQGSEEDYLAQSKFVCGYKNYHILSVKNFETIKIKRCYRQILRQRIKRLPNLKLTLMIPMYWRSCVTGNAFLTIFCAIIVLLISY